MELRVVEGDLLRQPVEVIVNSWNRNFIPHWLLIPVGVSGAIRRQAGSQPFREVRKHGLLPVGAAVLTGAGRLPYKGIIHVAGLNWWWTANRRSVELSVRNALRVFQEHGFASLAFPLIGAGTGGMSQQQVEELMASEIQSQSGPGQVLLVRYRKKT
ncbi:Appr-1-p processing protein [bacterium SCN 62-11]|nr:macro domain-containing protein [Candidatus Eremiobacteraeota bacterium]ODT57472.1 MAG: Appr-1-p processing protein [bacterium SCN 62-11]